MGVGLLSDLEGGGEVRLYGGDGLDAYLAPTLDAVLHHVLGVPQLLAVLDIVPVGEAV